MAQVKRRGTKQLAVCPAKPGQCSHPDICASHGCAALESRSRKSRHDRAVAIVRKQLRLMLIADGTEPRREWRGSPDWLIPASEHDAALRLDELAEAVVSALARD